MKVMIVDDEVLVRLGIKTYLEGYGDIEVKGTFATAKEALAYMEREEVDIVLTDIEMGQMNGLEYIKALKACNYTCGIVIISCHENFEYVRDAMDLGADKYMLKQEVREDILVNELREIYKKKQSETGREAPGVSLAQNDKLGSWEDTKFPCGEVVYQIATLKLWEEYDETGREKIRNLDEDMLFQVLDDAVAQMKSAILLRDHQGRMFLIFQFPKNMGESEREERVSGVYYRLEQNTRLYVNRSIAMGISRPFYNQRSMKENYETARKCLEYRFYDNREIFADIPEGSCYLDLQLDIESLIRQDGVSIFTEQLEDYLIQCRMKKVSPESIKDTILKSTHVFFSEVLKFYHIEGEKEAFIQYDLSYQELYDVHSMKVLKKIIIDHIDSFITAVLQKLDQSDDFPRVLRYIDEHYKEQLSLSEVSEKYYMSVNYFCQMFKKYTGTTFVNYINEKRIGEVKDYLHNGSYSLEVISELTGFHNVNYMIRLFKKITGITIREYRNGLKK